MTTQRYERSGLTKRQSGREVRQLSKSDLENKRRTRKRSSAPAKKLQTEKPLRAMRGMGPASRVLREGPGDFRYVGDVAIYRTRRNGVPVSEPYVWGASRGTASFRRLDMEAIEAADLTFDRRRKPGPVTGGSQLRAEIMRLHAENPGMSGTALAILAGCSQGSVSKVLHSVAREPLRSYCQECGRQMQAAAGQKFCSNACRQRDKRKRQQADALRAGGHCPDCGFWLTSQEHRLTCLAMVPDAEPPMAPRKMRPQDAARVRGAA